MKLKPCNQVITEADGRRTYRGREVRREAYEDDQPSSASSSQPKQPAPSKAERLPATPPVLNRRSSSTLPTSRDSSTVDQPTKKMPAIEKPAAHQEKKVAKIKQAPVNPAVALRIAITKGRINEVRALLGSGAFVDLADRQGATLLFLAAEKGHTKIAALLLKNGASVDLAKRNGATPLFIAAQLGHAEIATLLMRKGARVDLAMSNGATPLFIATQNGHAALAALLLENGVKVDVAMTDGATPLFIAAQNGHAALAALLLQNGAKVDVAFNDGATPLFIAAQNGHTALATLLLDKGAKVNSAKTNGATPLFIAAQKGHTALAVLLLQKGAKVDLAMRNGATPLFIAVQEGHAGIVSALILQNKSDLAAQGFFTRSLQNFATSYVDKADHKGITPLVAAIEKGHLAVVSVLVAAGASIDLPDAQNNTPLLLAASTNDPHIVALLLQAGANSGIKNKAGQSALDLALASSEPNSLLIDLLLEDASTLKRSSFLASAYTQLAPQLDMLQLAKQACALLMKLQHADATVQATDWRTFVNALCTKFGLRHIVAEGLVAMLRQMPADWPSVGGGTSKPTAAQVRQFYLHMLGSAQRLHALNNQDEPHRAAYYQAPQDMPAAAKLIGLAASQSGQLIGAGQTALGDWAGSLQRFFSGLSAANSAADIDTQLQNEMGIHPLLATTIAPLWASLKTKSVAGLILAMRKKFNTPEFASTVLEAGDSDVLRFMLMEQLQVLNKLKAPRRNKE